MYYTLIKFKHMYVCNWLGNDDIQSEDGLDDFIKLCRVFLRNRKQKDFEMIVLK